MSIDLVVQNPISATLQHVDDQNNTQTGLWLAKEATAVVGRDAVGSTLPLTVSGITDAATFDAGKTWGRLVRLRANDNNTSFYDIGIDKGGNLFINSVSSTKDVHVLTISPAGAINLNMGGVTTVPATVKAFDLCVDPANGRVYRR